MSDLVLDRRSFIGALSLTAAGSLFIGRAWAACAEAEVGTWHVDDMWGHMPRYAHPISCRPVHDPVNWDNVDPVDRAFVS
jgi:hypothetical protein